ncbi:MAG: hypothetical protein Q9195_007178 [Heterodermia aff. obscurata]
MASSPSMSRLELLLPETQSLILCHISTAKTLHSLISASPRFYQVFKSRREYHLTQLAKQQCRHSESAWDAITASNLPKPLSFAAADDFIENFYDDDRWEANIMPLDVSIPMIRLGSCVEWFITDLASSCLLNLTHLKKLMGLKQNDLVLQSSLSEAEMVRIRRAFFRFELSRHICQRKSDDMHIADMSLQNGRFLLKYDLDEIEEITCVRDYIVRRLWAVFDQMEDDLVQGAQAGLVPEVLQATQLLPDCENWFGVHAKQKHDKHTEHMMFLGLSYLKDVFTADKESRMELILSASAETVECWGDDLLTQALYDTPKRDLGPDTPKFYSFSASNFRDHFEDYSLGWRWIQRQLPPGYDNGKGPRDWGYIFWSPERLTASGIFTA